MVHPFCRSKVRRMKSSIRIRYSHESCLPLEAQVKQHLRADHDIKVAGGKQTKKCPRVGWTTDRLAIHTSHARLREHAPDRFFKSLRAGSYGFQLQRLAPATMFRDGFRLATVVAAHMVAALMKR